MWPRQCCISKRTRSSYYWIEARTNPGFGAAVTPAATTYRQVRRAGQKSFLSNPPRFPPHRQFCFAFFPHRSTRAWRGEATLYRKMTSIERRNPFLRVGAVVPIEGGAADNLLLHSKHRPPTPFCFLTCSILSRSSNSSPWRWSASMKDGLVGTERNGKAARNGIIRFHSHFFPSFSVEESAAIW